jgi:hypothetical protein
MENPKIILLGGCHVAGYLVGQENAFSTKLGELLHGKIVGQAARVRVVDLPEYLRLVEEKRPTHVVLQLGNHEFSASLHLMLRQFSRALGRKPAGRKAAATPSGPANSSTEPAPGQPLLAPSRFFRLRVLGLSVLTTLLWLFAKQYRRSIRALNACMKQHPDTAFIFLSPFPCRPAADNAVRDFGGWLLRHRVAALPNRYWLDSHQVLHPDRELFTDPWHLNAQAHTALAYCLAGILHSNAAYTHPPQP